MNPSHIPTCLTTHHQWVLWRWETRDGKATKVPYRAGAPHLRAEADNPDTWTSYQAALAAYKHSQGNGRAFDGLGFVVTQADEYVGIDLDKCLDPDSGEVSDWAVEVLNAFNSYAEITPSQRGLRIWIKGKLPPGGRRKGGLELYETGRYFTLTGNRLLEKPAEIANCQDALNALHARVFPKVEKPKPKAAVAPSVLTLSDNELLDKAFGAKNGSEFRSLWNGNTSAHGDDASAADLALCSHLMFWTGGDAGQSDRLFRQSGLMRPKWDKQHAGDGRTYGQLTMDKAASTVTEVYQARPGAPTTIETPPNDSAQKSIPPPVLSEGALYGLAGDVVALCTEDSEVDPAAILFTFGAWFGAAAGNRSRVMVGDTAHCPRLSTVLVGKSSRARKGTSKGPVQRIMSAAQGFESTPGMILPSLGPVTKVDGPLSSGEGLIYAVRDPTQNAKGEIDDPGVSDKRLLVIEGEFGSAFRSMQRQGNTLSNVLRLAWDLAHSQDVLSPMTKNSRIAATNPHICVVGHITQAELASLLTSVDLYNGLANRILWACVRRQKPVAMPKPLDDKAVRQIGQRIASALRLAQEKQKDVELTEAATEKWLAVYDELTVDKPGAYRAATSRAEAQTIRLALIYALLDKAPRVDIHHIEAALAAWSYWGL